MKLSELKVLYKSCALSKSEYIQKAYMEFHSTLFDYIETTELTDVKEIRIAPDGVSFIIGDESIKLYVPQQETRVAPFEIMNFDHYEPEETRAMDLLSVGARNILDIGANIGLYSIRFAKLMPSVRVFSFEPMPVSFAYLQRNIASNSVGNRVTSFNYGLSKTNSVVEFFSVPMNGVNASLKNVAASAEAVKILGLTLTLDEWVANYKVVPDFIKCDVEGAELLVFQGGLSTLATYKPIVFSEMLRKWTRPFSYQPNDMLAYFKELGYGCFAVGEKGSHLITEVTEETVETNYAFLHVEVHAALIDALAGKK